MCSSAEISEAASAGSDAERKECGSSRHLSAALI